MNAQDSEIFTIIVYFIETEAYKGPYQTSMKELITKIVNGYKPLTFFAKEHYHRFLQDS